MSVPCYCLKVLARTQLVRAGMTQGFGIWKADLVPLKEDFAPYVPGPTPCMACEYFSVGIKDLNSYNFTASVIILCLPSRIKDISESGVLKLALSK